MGKKKKSPPALGPLAGWRGSLRLLSLERSPEFTIITLASQEKSIWRCPPPLWNQECKLHASHLYFGHCFAFSVGFSQSSCRWGGWWSAVYLVWCQEQHQFLGSSSRLYTSFYLLGTKIVCTLHTHPVGKLAGGHVEHCYPLISCQREPTATGITSSRDEWRMDRKHFSIGVQVPLANHGGWLNCWFLLPTYLPTYW